MRFCDCSFSVFGRRTDSSVVESPAGISVVPQTLEIVIFHSHSRRRSVSLFQYPHGPSRSEAEKCAQICWLTRNYSDLTGIPCENLRRSVRPRFAVAASSGGFFQGR